MKIITSIAVDQMDTIADRTMGLEGLADVVELRLDCCAQIDLQRLSALIENQPMSFMLTLRRKDQGGAFSGDETQRLQLLDELAKLNPDYLDIEYDVDADFFAQIKQRSPTTKIVCSYHDFESTPENLSSVYQAMQQKPADIYKIVTYAESILDSLRMMIFVRDQSDDQLLVGHCMGELGIVSRIASPIVGNYFCYACESEDQALVPYQLTLSEVHQRYYLPRLSRDSQLLGLLGHPVSQSPGVILHNHLLSQYQLNALYVNFDCQPEELPAFFKYVEQLPFLGLSVTMPHKADVLSYCQPVKSDVAAANTLKWQEGAVSAINTDGLGALAAISDKIELKDKKVLILGAGGTAHNIIDDLLKETQAITVANRSLERRQELLARYNAVTVIDFEQVLTAEQSFDIIISTLPPAAFINTQILSWLLPIIDQQPVVFDVVYRPEKTLLLQFAAQHGCDTVTGLMMFIHQALLQFNEWFNLKLTISQLDQRLIGQLKLWCYGADNSGNL